MAMKFVSVIIQNKCDYETIKSCFEIFEKFSVKYELRVLCPIKNTQQTLQYVKESLQKGAAVFITASSEPSHLYGAVACQTIHPVISVCLNQNEQPRALMPQSIPVAHVQSGENGVYNAAYLAMQILALNDKELAAKLIEDRIVQQKEISTLCKELEVLL
jgi:5-(carboxyamino)imidazole ribonucleotide mutase